MGEHEKHDPADDYAADTTLEEVAEVATTHPEDDEPLQYAGDFVNGKEETN